MNYLNSLILQAEKLYTQVQQEKEPATAGHFHTITTTEQNILIALAGTSGAGKNALMSVIQSHLPLDGCLIRTTTRPVRKGETHGVDYYFVTEKEFNQYKESGAFIGYERSQEGYGYGFIHPDLQVESHQNINNIGKTGGKAYLGLAGAQLGDLLAANPSNMRKWLIQGAYVIPGSAHEQVSRLKTRGASENVIIQRMHDTIRYLDDYLNPDHPLSRLPLIINGNEMTPEERILSLLAPTVSLSSYK